MAQLQQASGPGSRAKFWVPISIIGLVAVTAGVFIPQMLPPLSAPAKSAPSLEIPKKDDLTYTPPAFAEGPDPKAMIIRLTLGTAIVLGLCVGTLWLSKRWLRAIPGRPASAGPLHLVDSLNLGNRCSVYLIGAGQRQVLVGIDASGLKSLVPLPDSFADTLTRAQDEPAAAANQDLVERRTLRDDADGSYGQV